MHGPIRRTDARQLPPQDPLLFVPQNTSLMLDSDLRAAGIPQYMPDGKVDFHALRVAYVTFIFEGGATPPEARELARHHHPELTLGVYARTRTARLQALVDEVAMIIIPDAKCASGVHATVGEDKSVAPLQKNAAPWRQALILPMDVATVCRTYTRESGFHLVVGFIEAVEIQRRNMTMALTGRDMIEAARKAVAQIPNDQLHAQLTAGTPVVVIDVREKEEWDAGHIPQGTFLSRGRLEGRVEELIPDKNTPIVTH